LILKGEEFLIERVKIIGWAALPGLIPGKKGDKVKLILN
jgi:hypothetical protein